MNLYLISQNVNSDYDTYDSAVVAAETEEQARHTSPSNNYEWRDDQWVFLYADGRVQGCGRTLSAWADPDDVEVEEIGTAKEGTTAGVILASFNAG